MIDLERSFHQVLTLIFDQMASGKHSHCQSHRILWCVDNPTLIHRFIVDRHTIGLCIGSFMHRVLCVMHRTTSFISSTSWKRRHQQTQLMVGNAVVQTQAFRELRIVDSAPWARASHQVRFARLQESNRHWNSHQRLQSLWEAHRQQQLFFVMLGLITCEWDHRGNRSR